MIAPDLSAALRPVLDVLHDLGVRHLVCGSIASSAHGVPRTSIDADVVAELGSEHADRLVASLAERYYVPEQQVRDAIRQRSSFSVIHLDTMVKSTSSSRATRLTIAKHWSDGSWPRSTTPARSRSRRQKTRCSRSCSGFDAAAKYPSASGPTSLASSESWEHWITRICVRAHRDAA